MIMRLRYREGAASPRHGPKVERVRSAIGKNVVVRVPASQADDLRAAVEDAHLPGRIQSRVHFAWVGDSFEVVLEGVRVGDRDQRNGWESPFIGAIANRNIRVMLGQM